MGCKIFIWCLYLMWYAQALQARRGGKGKGGGSASAVEASEAGDVSRTPEDSVCSAEGPSHYTDGDTQAWAEGPPGAHHLHPLDSVKKKRVRSATPVQSETARESNAPTEETGSSNVV